MPLDSTKIAIEGATIPAVSGIFDLPERDAGRSVVLLAHGAGVPMDSPFMEHVAAGLADAGLPVLRFNYTYAERMRIEQKRKAPDRKPKLLAVHRAALATLRARYPGRGVVLAGKSMGGRMASYLVAEGEACAGLAFLGYPLHPQGKPDKPRSEHFPELKVPALFLVGTRDALSKLDVLDTALATYAGPYTKHVIEVGSHDFAVPKRAGRTRREVFAELVSTLVGWERQL